MISTIMNRYPQVSGNPMAMAMLCTELVTRGLYDDAFSMGVAAAEAAPHDIAIRDLVSATLSKNVPKWHVPMLKDRRRNVCYAEALRRVVQPGMTVLEIGSGAGFLSLVAARLGAKVYTCEANPLVAAAARFITLRNGLSENITVLSKLSSDLEIGIDLPQRADILMSELFDDTLFGDGIVTYIDDARERLLTPDAIIVPQRSELRIRLVAFDSPPKYAPLERVEGFDLSAFNVLAPRTSSYLRASKVGAIPLSEPISALSKDFAAAAPFGSDREVAKLLSFGGEVAGFSQWMRIIFADDLEYENDPDQPTWSHWGSPLTSLSKPRLTEPGEEIAVQVRRIDREVFYSAS